MIIAIFSTWGATLAGARSVETAVSEGKEPGQRSVWSGVYNEAQAKRGETLYRELCASCHLDTFTGGSEGPPLAGSIFLRNWNRRSVAELFELNGLTMPPAPMDRLSDQENADLVAVLLKANEFPAGEAELPSEVSLLKQIAIEIRAK